MRYHDFAYQPRQLEQTRRLVAKVVHHARDTIFQMPEVAVPRKLFAAILDRIQRLRAVESMAPS